MTRVAPIRDCLDDVYFSDKSGLEETSYVFIEQNALRDALQRLACQRAFCDR